MAFFENIPAYRPPVAVVTMPARSVPTLVELGVRIVEGIKTKVVIQGMLAKNKVTVKDTGCGTWNTGTGALAKFVSNEITVDPLVAQDQDCAETFVDTILQGMLKAGHATDSDLTGTQIEELVRAYAEGGIAKVPAGTRDEFGSLLDLSLKDMVDPVVYGDALRVWMLGDKTLTSNKDYNQTNGLRKKLLAAAPTAGATGTTGAYRGATIDIAALKADLQNALPAFLDDLLENCSDELQDIDDDQKAIYLTKSLYALVKKFYRSFPNLESSKLEYEKGDRTYYYDGKLIKELKVWEQYMKLDFGSQSPHLALYTAPKNLLWLTDLETDMTTAEFKYEAKERINWWRVLFRLGAGFAYDVLISFAV